MLSDEEMYQRMASGWKGGLQNGTVCGNGSILRNTIHIRRWLPETIKRLKIKLLCDAGAGDLHWVNHIDLGCEYRAFDLVPRRAIVKKHDITRKALPVCDAILCRMVLNHLDESRILMALELFKESAKYLIATQYSGDRPKRSDQFTRHDLTESPFLLNDPISSVKDGTEGNCKLAVFEL